MELIKRVFDKGQVALRFFCVRLYECFIRRKLRNDNFSIICSNCIGGIIYNRLGKEFLSPTINLWMTQHNFIRFAENLQEYLRSEIEFVDSEYAYPVGRIYAKEGHVTLHFNHSLSQDQAREDWFRRRARVNTNNLYIIMYDRDNISRDDILRLEGIPCCNKVAFSEKDYPGIPYVVKLKRSKRPDSAHFLDRDWLGICTFEKQFDFVTFLNQK